jgi:oxygen-independent coproporphyrinogen-3 oxidase
MSGLYIHIPFCKQACHYCDFHFSTSLKYRAEMVRAISKELLLRKKEQSGTIDTIYFGGGTPSLLTSTELEQLFNAIYTNYTVGANPEITLEANPDDLSDKRIEELARSEINRLSIGVQSFFEDDLQLMNRAHTAEEARSCIEKVKEYFDNFSIDLIYGMPGMTNQRWIENLAIAMEYDVPHLSCYALTVEPKTALKAMIEKGKVPAVDDEVAQKHHELLLKITEQLGYENYEFSNFGKQGFFSRNNLAYWQGKPYLGIGPSAHSFDGDSRSWNVASNPKYMKSVLLGSLPLEREQLSNRDKYNEYVMTGLRTMWGISLKTVAAKFGDSYQEYLLQQAEIHIANHLLFLDGDRLKVTKKGKFLSDGIAADLFLLNLDS